MNNLKKKFIKFALKKQALKFGEFYLKSGRLSPYFFNSSVFYKGKDILKLSKFYAKTIITSKLKFDVLFGLSYKGISILTSTIITLLNKYNLNIPFFFNRKEVKNYGEKGIFIGNSKYKNKKIIILDDVLTAGKTIKEAKKLIHSKAIISGICVAFNRKEYTKEEENVISIIDIIDILKYFKNKKLFKELKLIQTYCKKYNIK